MNAIFRPLLRQLPKPLRNRYAIVGMLFFLWMAFFDKHSMLTQYRLQQTLNKLKEDYIAYEQKILETEQERLAIEADKEKFAREQYFMHKADEEVFIIAEEE